LGILNLLFENRLKKSLSFFKFLDIGQIQARIAKKLTILMAEAVMGILNQSRADIKKV